MKILWTIMARSPETLNKDPDFGICGRLLLDWCFRHVCLTTCM